MMKLNEWNSPSTYGDPRKRRFMEPQIIQVTRDFGANPEYYYAENGIILDLYRSFKPVTPTELREGAEVIRYTPVKNLATWIQDAREDAEVSAYVEENVRESNKAVNAGIEAGELWECPYCGCINEFSRGYTCGGCGGC